MPFPDQPPLPPTLQVLNKIRHAPTIGCRTHGPAIDEERQRRQETRRSCRETQRGEGSSSGFPASEPHTFDTIGTMMAQGFETLNLG